MKTYEDQDDCLCMDLRGFVVFLFSAVDDASDVSSHSTILIVLVGGGHGLFIVVMYGFHSVLAVKK